MKTYRVHFSFYSEEYGNFDECAYKVEAEDVFAARRMAWAVCDADGDAALRSCVRQCGVTWDASPLDLRDLFNAQAASDRLALRVLEAVTLPNAEIGRDADAKEHAKRERAYLFGCADTTRRLARDLGKPHGMAPPDVFEEIEYAWELVGKLDTEGKHERAQALADIADRAKSWDVGAGRALKELFTSGCITLCGETETFTEHFGRDGVYPIKADAGESDYGHISRWSRAPSVGRLSALPAFDGRHVICGGEEMQYNHRPLVLSLGDLRPEEILWTPCEDAEDITFDHSGAFPCENLVTGARATFRRGDFCGVLRPEFEQNIKFDALKREYAAAHADEPENGESDEDDREWGDD
ncbi:MAG: hypothetical protein LBP73_07210 [Clostridiales Family XIII bacterium]|jgi:hypothetical protein|nr:hypothetical protein [Clostridiales Family XIII bacterium]